MLKENLIVVPKFSGEWIGDDIKTLSDIIYYEENNFIRKSKFWKTLQALAYVLDLILPRSLAVSGKIRGWRVINSVCEEFYAQIDVISNSYKKILFIKAYGCRSCYLSENIKNKLTLILWDSIARYPLHRSMMHYLYGTTSPYDAKKLNIKLINFRVRKNRASEIENKIYERSIFVGRFSILRFVKLYWLAINNKSIHAYFGKSPLNVKIGRIQLSREYITLHTEKYNELVISDLNEDSPSFRIDCANQKTIITDLPISSMISESANVFSIYYIPPRIRMRPSINELRSERFADLLT